ncbi:hypothetical protein [Mesonia aestuariivivens]|uniref:Lipoprotein n=1 Tax=Mesonia aestuariivivens TaxID=2796128 RepID=A0ABS6W2M2_9FLAO|nr:hypothetical protein [Mesonia aestuariivivens]MBW2962106.1 hypothetical protein [Mesonia aestuariivivens]
MKKTFILFCLSLSLFSCSSLFKKNNEGVKSNRADTVNLEYPILTEGKVYKIDSTKNYYLIYLKDKKTNYKIVSSKEKNNVCEKIAVNEIYSFNLKNITNGKNVAESNKAFMPTNYLILERCINGKNSEKICVEGDVDLYKSANLQGLCYIIINR